MIENLNDHLIGIAVGIRLLPNFTIDDQVGHITEMILYSENSFFNPQVFSKVSSDSSGKQILFNEINSDKLIIDRSNVILEMDIGPDNKFDIDNVDEILKAFNNQIIHGVFDEFSIKKILRVGYIRRYLFKDEELINSILNKIVGEKITKVNELNLRFSKKYFDTKSISNEKVANFKNVIFTIEKKAEKENEIRISFDFQKIFNPVIQSFAKIKFSKFLEDAKYFNSKQFLPWLNSFYQET